MGSLGALRLCNREVKATPRQKGGETSRDKEKNDSRSYQLPGRGREAVRSGTGTWAPGRHATPRARKGLSVAAEPREASAQEQVAAQHVQGCSGLKDRVTVRVGGAQAPGC